MDVNSKKLHEEEVKNLIKPRQNSTYYKGKFSFFSFTLSYLFSFGIGVGLILYSSLLSSNITHVLYSIHSEWLTNDVKKYLYNIPYGILFSIPFLLYGVKILLWNIMGFYEINKEGIYLLLGSFNRREYYFSIDVFRGVTYKQNLLEVPFNVGTIILDSKKGEKLLIIGVNKIKEVTNFLRANINKHQHIKEDKKTEVPINSHEISSSNFHENKTVVVHKSGRCLGCLVIIIIIILIPVVLGVIFKIAIITTILGYIESLFNR